MILPPDNLDDILEGKVHRQSYQFDAAWKEAAWFIIKQFIHPFDWSRLAYSPALDGYTVLPAHTNASFLSILAPGRPMETPLGQIAPVRDPIRAFTRSMFDAHLEGHATYYFRSRDHCYVRTGYQSYDEGYKKLPFDARLLGIDGRVAKRKNRKSVVAVVDIDDKLKLGIAKPIRDWLINNFFPGSYHETSTNGYGVHLYLNLVMPIGTKIHWVRTWMNSVINFLAFKLSEWMKVNNSLKELLTEHLDLLISHFKVNTLNELIPLVAKSSLDKVAGLPTCWDQANRLKRGICIRIPRFPNQMDSVIAFAMQPAILCRPWKAKMDAMMQAEGPPREKRDIYCMYKRASPTPGRTSDIEKEEELDHETAPEDAFERTFYFLLEQCRKERRILLVDEGMKIYEESGLATGFSEIERNQRRYRVSQALKQIGKSFDAEKIKGRKFDYLLVGDLAEELIVRVFGKEDDLVYKDGKRIRKVKVQEVALVYTLVRNNLGQGYRGGVSVEMVNRILTENGLSKAMRTAKAVRAKLVDSGLLRRVAPAVRGVQGDRFALGEPYEKVAVGRSMGDMEAEVEEIIGRR